MHGELDTSQREMGIKLTTRHCHLLLFFATIHCCSLRPFVRPFFMRSMETDKPFLHLSTMLIAVPTSFSSIVLIAIPFDPIAFQPKTLQQSIRHSFPFMLLLRSFLLARFLHLTTNTLLRLEQSLASTIP